MPLEIALLPFIESKFAPYAKSNYGAVGYWQFMPSTARHMKLKMDWWFDGRRDIVLATKAALDYLERLVRYFDGDYYLAIAAYNSGPARVKRIVNDYKARGLYTNFWSLDLPRETQRYVPALLALAEVVSWGEINGSTLPHIPNEPFLHAVELPGQIDLLQAVKMAGIDIDTFFLYNAGYRRWATPPTGPNRLLLPKAEAEKIRQALTQVEPASLVSWRAHEVRLGDNLTALAKRYQTTPSILRQVNQMSTDTIVLGDYLLIPNSGAEILPRGGLLIHRSKEGETLDSLAIEYGISKEEIVRSNQKLLGQTDFLRPGQRIRINLGPTLPEEQLGARVASYRIRGGDSLIAIARKFGTTAAELKELNGLRSSVLHAGADIQIPIRWSPIEAAQKNR